MNPDPNPLERLMHSARAALRPEAPNPTLLTARVLARLRETAQPAPPNLQPVLALGLGVAASITLLILLSADLLNLQTALTEPEPLAPFLLDLSDL